MKKIICMILVLALLVGVLCFSANAIESRISDIFPDANLAAEVAKQLGKSVDDAVTGEELAAVTKIGDCDTYCNNIVSVEISSLKGLERLINLQILCVTGRGIKSADEVADLINLRILYICNASLTQIPPVNKLLELEYLILNDNKIRKIEGLDNLANLRRVELDDNLISKVEGVFKLGSNTYGSVISIENNNISNLNFLYTDDAKNAYILDYNLAGNYISSLKPLDEFECEHARVYFYMNSQQVISKTIIDPYDSNTLRAYSIVECRYSFYAQPIGGAWDYINQKHYIDIEIPEDDSGTVLYKFKEGANVAPYSYSFSGTVTQRWMRGFSKYDVTDDGIANVADILSMKSMIMDGVDSIEHDIDNDGRITVSDILALKNFIMSFDF